MRRSGRRILAGGVAVGLLIGAIGAAPPATGEPPPQSNSHRPDWAGKPDGDITATPPGQALIDEVMDDHPERMLGRSKLAVVKQTAPNGEASIVVYDPTIANVLPPVVEDGGIAYPMEPIPPAEYVEEPEGSIGRGVLLLPAQDDGGSSPPAPGVDPGDGDDDPVAGPPPPPKWERIIEGWAKYKTEDGAEFEPQWDWQRLLHDGVAGVSYFSMAFWGTGGAKDAGSLCGSSPCRLRMIKVKIEEDLYDCRYNDPNGTATCDFWERLYDPDHTLYRFKPPDSNTTGCQAGNSLSIGGSYNGVGATVNFPSLRFCEDQIMDRGYPNSNVWITNGWWGDTPYTREIGASVVTSVPSGQGPGEYLIKHWVDGTNPCEDHEWMC